MSGIESFGKRRERRENVEMLARFRRGLGSVTVMLKDLTCRGAMIEGVGHLVQDEAIHLALPGRRPAMAFVAWSTEHSAGLEFAEPLDGAIFHDLVARFGRGAAASQPISHAA
jgi:hypothetical protein